MDVSGHRRRAVAGPRVGRRRQASHVDERLALRTPQVAHGERRQQRHAPGPTLGLLALGGRPRAAPRLARQQRGQAEARPPVRRLGVRRRREDLRVAAEPLRRPRRASAARAGSLLVAQRGRPSARRAARVRLARRPAGRAAALALAGQAVGQADWHPQSGPRDWALAREDGVAVVAQPHSAQLAHPRVAQQLRELRVAQGGLAELGGVPLLEEALQV
mmetsp:Transcript_105690/g.299224  ORF Transcript_105690/g.299224 Transcript_105690/m.299224 type:complete len:218 (-) Transcript_105690:1226-1879(-)